MELTRAKLGLDILRFRDEQIAVRREKRIRELPSGRSSTARC